ncbi:hypothetical protein [Bosea caraganae]|uniref:hypothetical protein n=1 Tax=Bosea caraganae TaxID=2763117 RepID=UPI0015EFFA67|nr:hypothetical protein [Bosea caraganae]
MVAYDALRWPERRRVLRADKRAKPSDGALLDLLQSLALLLLLAGVIAIRVGLITSTG